MVDFGGVLKAAAPVKPIDKYIAQEMMMESQMTRWMLVDGWTLLTNAGIVVTYIERGQIVNDQNKHVVIM